MSVVITIIGKIAQLVGPFAKGTRSIAGMGKAIGGLGLKFAKFGAIAGVAIAGIGIKLAADLGDGLREVGTLMGGLTDNQLKNMTKELESLAASSGKAIDTLVKAKYDIVSAGFANAADSAMLLNQAADLAIGGVTEVSVAADLLTTTINAYNLAAEDAVVVSDKLFTIVRLGKTTMSELGSSMGRVVAIAGQAGISLDEVGAAVASLTAQGLDSARAVTSLQGAIIQILKPTEIMKTLIQDLGFATGDALLKQEGFAESLKLIKARADELSLPLSEVFGSIEALQAVLPLTGTAAEGFAENLAEMERSAGATADAVTEMEKSFSQDMRKLRQNVNNILRTIGRALIEIIRPGVQEANRLLASLGDIGWDNIAKAVSENWNQISKSLIEILSLTLSAMSVMVESSANKMWNSLWTKFSPLTTKKQLAEVNKAWDEWANEQLAEIWDSIADSAISTFTLVISEAERAAIDVSKALEEIEDAAAGLEEQLEDTGEAFDNLGSDALIDIAGQADALSSSLARAVVHGDGLVGVFKRALLNLAAMVIEAIILKAVIESIPGAKTLGFVEKGVSKIGKVFGFDKGGVVPNFAHGGVVPINAHAGEIVSTQQAANLFGSQIMQMNQRAEGLTGAQQGGGDTFIIQALDAQSFEQALKRNGLALGIGIREATRNRNLKSTDLPA